MFSSKPRCQYRNNQLADVICQLRFPDILSINANDPAVFQEIIRNEYPQYAKGVDNVPPKVVGTPGNLRLETAPATTNYQFTSADGVWRINLTSRFISITCTRYTNWETFAKKFDKPLAAFIKVYKPAYFQRIGLRYLNFISKNELGLTDTSFSDLIQPMYLGLLANDDIADQQFNQNNVDAEVSLPSGCRLKLHAGPGLVKRNGRPDNEVKFIFDQDLFIAGNIPVHQAADSLEKLHNQAFPIFRGVITETLHNAMEPID